MSSIGILGAGKIGQAIAKQLARHGIEATIANSRGPESLAALSLGASIRAGTREEVASKDIVFVAIPWPQLRDAVKGLKLEGRIVVDANNSVAAPPMTPADLQGRTSSEVFAEWLPRVRLVKAFNHLLAALLERDASERGGKRVLFVASDDADAKAQVAQLIERLGFFPLDLGSLAVGAKLAQFPGGSLVGLDLVKFG